MTSIPVPTAAAVPVPALRWRIPLVLMVTLFVGYLDRMNISLALPLLAREFGWDEAQIKSHGGELLTLFYVGYGLANMLLSPLGARVGPRRSLAAIIVLWSLFTALGAWVSASIAALAATRVLLGLAEGIHFPMMNLLTKHWFPPQERARANGLWMAGLLLGICLSPVILVPLMHAFGWRAGFAVLAVAGLMVSLPLVLLFVWNTPATHPRIDAAERRMIEAALAAEPLAVAPGRGALWRAMTQPGMLLMLAIGMLSNIVAMGLALWLPTYFVTNKGLPYESLVYATSLPYIAGVAGLLLWSRLGDRTNRRAWIGAAGMLGAGIAIWFALRAPGVPLAIAAFAVGCFFISAFPACEFSLVQRLLPAECVGQGAGWYNGLTTLVGGGLAPVVISAIIGGAKADGNPAGILAAAGTCAVVAALLFVLGRRLRY